MKDLFNISSKELLSHQIISWAYTEKMKPFTYEYYLDWVKSSQHGPLKYLTDHRMEMRKSLKEYYPDCESALVFLFDYREAKNYISKKETRMASYTIGFEDCDYHYWIKEKLEWIYSELKKSHPDIESKISLDIHPVLERDLAFRAGLGWFGKNSMIINKEFGSYQLIGSVLLNKKLELKKNEFSPDHCGTCTRCIDACPTKAINIKKRTIDANLCISTFTIEEFKDSAPPTGYPTKTKEVFGCDICQEVCPWNDKALKKAGSLSQSKLVDFFNRDLKSIYNDINEMSNKEYKVFFKNTSFERSGKRGLLKNLKHYLL